jgi:hypothetical protein
MSRPRGITRQAVSICVLGLLSIAAFADDKYVKSKDPVFLEVHPDHALVYFARPDFTRLIPEGTFKVFVDSTPTGWLPQRSYMAAQVDPGSRVVWGPMDARQRFDFQAGKTYFLILSSNTVLPTGRWLEPRGLRAIRRTSKGSLRTRSCPM